jgi:hypothetical protein
MFYRCEHIYVKIFCRCLKWRAFCQNPALNQIAPEVLSAKQSLFVCSQHFDQNDYHVNKDVNHGEPQKRLSTSGALPKIRGSCVLDEDGITLISPIKPPINEFAARMIGLKPISTNDDEDEDDEDRWQYENYEESFNKVTAAFGETSGKLMWPTYLLIC